MQSLSLVMLSKGRPVMQNSAAPEASPRARIPLGVSACLLGQPVRFDSGHKRCPYLLDELAAYFEFTPVCPEVAIGLGTPREPIRLVQEAERIAVRGVRSASLDVTDALHAYGRDIAARLPDLCGYVLKKNSPSCGMERVKLYAPNGYSIPGGAPGAYAESLMAARPLLPVEEEGRLNDPALRENFIERVFVTHRWHELLRRGLRPASLLAFHTEHKFLILAHDEGVYRELGRLLAEAGTRPLQDLADEYIGRLMPALKGIATRRRHVNVLQHCLGFLRRQLDGRDRGELAQAIEDYRLGVVPLIVPTRLFDLFLRRHDEPYLSRQWYFHPYPEALGLRNVI